MLVILGDVRRHVQVAHVLDKTGRVIVLVAAQRHASITGNLPGHRERRVTLGRARRPLHRRVDGQPVAVLHQHAPGITQLGLFAGALTCQLGIGIGRRGMRRITPRFPVKIHRWIAGVVRRWIDVADLLETLQTRPRLQQRPIDREVFVRDQISRLGFVQHRLEEQRRHVGGQQPVPILAEHRRVPHRVIDVQADKPSEQQVVFQLLHQHPLAADRVQHLQQQRAEQLFWRNRGAADVRIHAGELGRQRGKHAIGHLADGP